MRLSIRIRERPKIDVKMRLPDKLSLQFKNIVIQETLLPFYEGDYTITPQWNEQSIATRQKSMRDDLTVKEIYMSEVENEFGGITLSI